MQERAPKRARMKIIDAGEVCKAAPGPQSGTRVGLVSLKEKEKASAASTWSG